MHTEDSLLTPAGKSVHVRRLPFLYLQRGWWALKNYPAQAIGTLLDESQGWRREELENFRDEKLRKLIIHCYQNVPYYRHTMDKERLRPTDIRAAGDLSKLPVLTKDTLRKHWKALRAQNIPEKHVSIVSTGGTTGEPIRVCKDRECQAWENMCAARGWSWGGLQATEPRIRLLGGSLGIAKPGIKAGFRTALRGDLVLPAFELRQSTATTYFDKIRKSKCRFLVGYASAIYRLAVLAKDMGEELGFAAVFPTAELMLPDWEKVIRQVFKCAVLPFYGCGEVNSLGFYVAKSNAYLIPEEHALIEVMRGDSSTGLSGDGPFLITNLDNYAMPIVRYANGDAGKIIPAIESSPFSMIERLDGRFNSFLMTDSGDLIPGTIGTHIFRLCTSVKKYQIIQAEPLRVVIRVSPKDGFCKDEEDLVLRLFAEHLGRRMKINIEKVDNIPSPPSGKSVFVINRCLETPSFVHSVFSETR